MLITVDNYWENNTIHRQDKYVSNFLILLRGYLGIFSILIELKKKNYTRFDNKYYVNYTILK